LEENKSLRAEVQTLKEENKRLKEQCASVEALQSEKAEL
jgi:cell shape-determining protein MreC